MLSRLSFNLNSRLLTRTCPISQNLTNKSMHISCKINGKSLQSFKYHNSSDKIKKYAPIFGCAFVRTISTDGVEGQTSVSAASGTGSSATEQIVENIPADTAAAHIIDTIPDAPVPPVTSVEDIVEAASTVTLNALGEPTFASLGLGGWWPIGIVQRSLEWIHVTADIPWWGTIVIGTILVRCLIFPLVIISQRQAAHMNNVMPEMTKIQAKLTDARMSGDQLGAARYTFELMEFMKEKKCNPMKNLIAPAVQAPIFISFFIGLKRMANLPVESMRDGGLLWFSDLTISDPYYILPILTSGTLALTIKFGIDTPQLQTMGWMKYIVQFIPIAILPFMINFPAAITWYWLSTNLISMGQVVILRIPAVRDYLKIPKTIKHKKDEMPKKNFKEGFQESMSNFKLAREMGDRTYLDAVQFNKAGRGPVQKTYAYNPIAEHLKKQKATKR